MPRRAATSGCTRSSSTAIACWPICATARSSCCSRNGLDWTDKFPELAEALSRLPVDEAVLDGEIVLLKRQRRHRFLGAAERDRRTQHGGPRLHGLRSALSSTAGTSPAPHSMSARRPLRSCLAAEQLPTMRYSDHPDRQRAGFLRRGVRRPPRRHHLEAARCATISRGAARPGSKSKCGKREEFVIVGFTDPAGSRAGFGALLMGYHTAKGDARLCRPRRHRLCRQAARRVAPQAGLAGAAQADGEAPGGALRARHALGEARAGGRGRDSPTGRRTASCASRASSASARTSRRTKSCSIPWPRRNRRHRWRWRSRKQRSAATAPRSSRASASPMRRARSIPNRGSPSWRSPNIYTAIAEHMLPHVARRPLSLLRCPEGVNGERFFQKHLMPGTPAALKRIPVADEGGHRGLPDDRGCRGPRRAGADGRVGDPSLGLDDRQSGKARPPHLRSRSR